jgi:hypothetical protein
MMRSIVAVVVGFLFIGVLSFGTDAVIRNVIPDAFDPSNGRTDNVALLLCTIAYVGIYAVIGCWLTARMAPAKPMKHALILGVLGLVFTAAGTAVAWDTAPVWYHVVSLATVMPYAWLGGRLAERQIRARTRL